MAKEISKIVEISPGVYATERASRTLGKIVTSTRPKSRIVSKVAGSTLPVETKTTTTQVDLTKLSPSEYEKAKEEYVQSHPKSEGGSTLDPRTQFELATGMLKIYKKETDLSQMPTVSIVHGKVKIEPKTKLVEQKRISTMQGSIVGSTLAERLTPQKTQAQIAIEEGRLKTYRRTPEGGKIETTKELTQTEKGVLVTPEVAKITSPSRVPEKIITTMERAMYSPESKIAMAQTMRSVEIPAFREVKEPKVYQGDSQLGEPRGSVYGGGGFGARPVEDDKFFSVESFKKGMEGTKLTIMDIGYKVATTLGKVRGKLEDVSVDVKKNVQEVFGGYTHSIASSFGIKEQKVSKYIGEFAGGISQIPSGIGSYILKGGEIFYGSSQLLSSEGRKAIGEESWRALKETPSAVIQSYDITKGEGALNFILTAMAFRGLVKYKQTSIAESKRVAIPEEITYSNVVAKPTLDYGKTIKSYLDKSMIEKFRVIPKAKGVSGFIEEPSVLRYWGAERPSFVAQFGKVGETSVMRWYNKDTGNLFIKAEKGSAFTIYKGKISEVSGIPGRVGMEPSLTLKGTYQTFRTRPTISTFLEGQELPIGITSEYIAYTQPMPYTTRFIYEMTIPKGGTTVSATTKPEIIGRIAYKGKTIGQVSSVRDVFYNPETGTRFYIDTDVSSVTNFFTSTKARRFQLTTGARATIYPKSGEGILYPKGGEPYNILKTTTKRIRPKLEFGKPEKATTTFSYEETKTVIDFDQLRSAKLGTYGASTKKQYFTQYPPEFDYVSKPLPSSMTELKARGEYGLKGYIKTEAVIKVTKAPKNLLIRYPDTSFGKVSGGLSSISESLLKEQSRMRISSEIGMPSLSFNMIPTESQLSPIIKTSTKSLSSTLLGTMSFQVQKPTTTTKLKAITKLSPISLSLSKLKISPITQLKISPISLVKVSPIEEISTKILQTQTTKISTKTISQTKQIQMTKLAPTTTIGTDTINFIPFIPSMPIGDITPRPPGIVWGFPDEVPSRPIRTTTTKSRKRKTKYQPTVSAFGLGIFGKGKMGKLSGLEQRPIPLSWKKMLKGFGM